MSAPLPRSATARLGSAVAWHDAECGSYVADLSLWEDRAVRCGGAVVELGAGTGRVALRLAARGHRVIAVDDHPELLAALAGRAAERGLDVEPLEADARQLRLPEPAPLIIAPMQLVLLMGGVEGRSRLLAAVARCLAPGGRFAAALLERDATVGTGAAEPMPDVREVGGWVHSSLPLRVVAGAETIEIHRLRQLVSPGGELREERDVIALDRLSDEDLLAEAEHHGLRPLDSVPIPETAEHVASRLVTMELADE